MELDGTSEVGDRPRRIQFKGLTHITVKSIAEFQSLYITTCSAHTAAPQKRSMFIQTQSTPNSESLMFHPDASWEFLKPEIFATFLYDQCSLCSSFLFCRQNH